MTYTAKEVREYAEIAVFAKATDMLSAFADMLEAQDKMALVPVEPTAAMLDAAVYAQEPSAGANRGGSNNVNRLRRRAKRIYAAMLRGSPHGQEIPLPSTRAAQGETVEISTGAEAESAQSGARPELIDAAMAEGGEG